MNLDDRRLIEHCLQGNLQAYGELVRRYQDRLYNAIYRVLDHADDTQDVVQEAFMNAFQSLSSFKGDSEFFTWLYRIAFNTAISLKRKRRVLLSLEPENDGSMSLDPIDPSERTQPGASLERTEQELKLNHALQRLSPEHRLVLVLKDIEGQKYERIAEILDVPIGTIRSRLHRARLELRELLIAGESDPDS
ncbi:RNA polymerase sigma factor [Tuwongella immobilis]|uniref:RNA polymerase sigma factor n=1 Tax=Tuwongella immobilis TaxID=692036 RepID=A0A6C2YPJ7_9BACT|nr:sigma-70 family RNA polymerase sigma factor [Tuwongella immobilis]VIP03109.1 rna polymerase sigma factor sigw : RNA polymerase sigma factor, sigma-70 family OS=Singulisphaera acidiphila (strain ATCC BAA-1392 / DSM 18658 / VKM B-2454 / MOB10) GN=Sinac_5873 PE=4 SV=1: Sigma70_r2: Sigma70_r4_2 [Tuwongella immobilis]VTS03415.1 rna polymerase sigma factor sigw : RNA polymerase sigma factor, sigma-70 family OS=Singulisphaera acidiphila (strain ATCC BAA-1392 / DSM 18658 / VKM B-2454 / MOB10) GN=Sinac